MLTESGAMLLLCPAAGLGVTQIIGPVVALGEDGAGASSARPHMRQLNGVERGQVGAAMVSRLGVLVWQRGAVCCHVRCLPSVTAPQASLTAGFRL